MREEFEKMTTTELLLIVNLKSGKKYSSDEIQEARLVYVEKMYKEMAASEKTKEPEPAPPVEEDITIFTPSRFKVEEAPVVSPPTSIEDTQKFTLPGSFAEPKETELHPEAFNLSETNDSDLSAEPSDLSAVPEQELSPSPVAEQPTSADTASPTEESEEYILSDHYKEIFDEEDRPKVRPVLYNLFFKNLTLPVVNILNLYIFIFTVFTLVVNYLHPLLNIYLVFSLLKLGFSATVWYLTLRNNCPKRLAVIFIISEFLLALAKIGYGLPALGIFETIFLGIVSVIVIIR